MLRKCLSIGIPLASISLLVACGSTQRYQRHELAYEQEHTIESQRQEAHTRQNHNDYGELQEIVQIIEEVHQDSLSQPSKRLITMHRHIAQRHHASDNAHRQEIQRSATARERNMRHTHSSRQQQSTKPYSSHLWLLLGIIATLLILARKRLGIAIRFIRAFR